MQNGTVLKRFFEKGFLYGAQRRFFFDDSDNPGSDDTIEKEEHYKWTIALEEEIKEDAVIPEEDLLEQAEPEVAERLILKRDLRKAAIARMEAAARTQGDFEDVIDA